MAKSLPDFDSVLIDLASHFQNHKIQYALIGGYAVSHQTRPRFTKDLDFLLTIPQLVLPSLLEEIHQEGEGRFDVMAVMREWIQHHMVVLDYKGFRIDWLKPAIPLHQNVLANAIERDVDGTKIRMASPEGLILLKLLAFRAPDKNDIESLIAVEGSSLDVHWIQKEWLTIGEEYDPPMQWFLTTYQTICGDSQ